MRTDQAQTVLSAYLDSDIPAFIWGAPGIGKSDVVAQTAAARGLKLIDLRAALLEPIDLRGLPSIDGDSVKWLPMGELPNAERDGLEGILFLDELNAAAPAVQAACFQLVLNRRVGTYHLPNGWRIVAAGNRQSDRASAQRMPSALANRFSHIEVEADVDSWSQWALASGQPAELVAFMRFRPELLHSFEPDRVVNATPRSWSQVGKITGAKLDSPTELAAIAGTVGDGPGAEFVGFLRVWRSLPSPDAVLMDPDGSDVPSDPATLWALMGALGRKVTEANIDNFARYLSRVGADYAVCGMRDAIARNKALTSTAAFVQWASDNQDVLL